MLTNLTPLLVHKPKNEYHWYCFNMTADYTTKLTVLRRRHVTYAKISRLSYVLWNMLRPHSSTFLTKLSSK